MGKIIEKGILATLGLLALAACESTYYSAMEQVGVHKRDILADRVEAARDAQQEAQQQFRSALEQFRSVVNFDGGELEDLYERLNDEFNDSETAAEDIRDRIDAIESVAEALFDEWEDEIGEYSSASLKRSSQRQLSDTRSQYSRLIKAMRSAESRLDPVLDAMRDQVLYLKHNLNARAVSALRGELSSINSDVDRLIAAMEAAIAEADRFIGQLQG